MAGREGRRRLPDTRESRGREKDRRREMPWEREDSLRAWGRQEPGADQRDGMPGDGPHTPPHTDAILRRLEDVERHMEDMT